MRLLGSTYAKNAFAAGIPPQTRLGSSQICRLASRPGGKRGKDRKGRGRREKDSRRGEEWHGRGRALRLHIPGCLFNPIRDLANLRKQQVLEMPIVCLFPFLLLPVAKRPPIQLGGLGCEGAVKQGPPGNLPVSRWASPPLLVTQMRLTFMK